MFSILILSSYISKTIRERESLNCKNVQHVKIYKNFPTVKNVRQLCEELFLLAILSLAAILVGSRDQRTQFWKGAIQESFQQSLVEIGSVVSEEKIFF
jgi:hypothetical protein